MINTMPSSSIRVLIAAAVAEVSSAPQDSAGRASKKRVAVKKSSSSNSSAMPKVATSKCNPPAEHEEVSIDLSIDLPIA